MWEQLLEGSEETETTLEMESIENYAGGQILVGQLHKTRNQAM